MLRVIYQVCHRGVQADRVARKGAGVGMKR
jgi:hypothetical protein